MGWLIQTQIGLRVLAFQMGSRAEDEEATRTDRDGQTENRRNQGSTENQQLPGVDDRRK